MLLNFSHRGIQGICNSFSQGLSRPLSLGPRFLSRIEDLSSRCCGACSQSLDLILLAPLLSAPTGREPIQSLTAQLTPGHATCCGCHHRAAARTH